jgi:hypothetical protein
MIKDEISKVQDLTGERKYIRDTFVRAGSLTNPKNSYHLEFALTDSKEAEKLLGILNRNNLNAKRNVYNGTNKIYIKNSDSIAEFLRLVGAFKSLFELENTRILKGISNEINRQTNCEAFNIGRTVRASLEQIEDIELIIEEMGLDSLPPTLAEMARCRLEYPDDNMEDLGKRLSITKSGANHRLRKLAGIAKSIRGEK